MEQNVRKDRICFEVLDEGNITEQQKIAVKYVASLDNTNKLLFWSKRPLQREKRGRLNHIDVNIKMNSKVMVGSHASICNVFCCTTARVYILRKSFHF